MQYYKYHCETCNVSLGQTLKDHEKALKELSVLEKLMLGGEEIECPNCGAPLRPELTESFDPYDMDALNDKGVGKFD